MISTDFPRKSQVISVLLGKIKPLSKEKSPKTCVPQFFEDIFQEYSNTHPTEHHWYSQLWALQWCLCTCGSRRYLWSSAQKSTRKSEGIWSQWTFKVGDVLTPCKSSFSDYKWTSGLVRILAQKNAWNWKGRLPNISATKKLGWHLSGGRGPFMLGSWPCKSQVSIPSASNSIFWRCQHNPPPKKHCTTTCTRGTKSTKDITV